MGSTVFLFWLQNMINIFLINRIKNKKHINSHTAQKIGIITNNIITTFIHIYVTKKTLCRLQKLIYFTQPIIKQLILLNNERDRCNHARTQRQRDP